MLLAGTAEAQAPYVPSEGNLQSRKEFSEHRLGIFLHWGIYSTYAQGEWYLSISKLDPETYSEAAAGFYPARFDADAWARAFKEAGAGYVTMTSRHHDGFSMLLLSMKQRTIRLQRLLWKRQRARATEMQLFSTTWVMLPFQKAM